jgi:hypothetical protein
MMAVIAISGGSIIVHWHMLPLFLLYPIWGIVQQFLIQGLVGICPERQACSALRG